MAIKNEQINSLGQKYHLLIIIQNIGFYLQLLAFQIKKYPLLKGYTNWITKEKLNLYFIIFHLICLQMNRVYQFHDHCAIFNILYNSAGWSRLDT